MPLLLETISALIGAEVRLWLNHLREYFWPQGIGFSKNRGVTMAMPGDSCHGWSLAQKKSPFLLRKK